MILNLNKTLFQVSTLNAPWGNISVAEERQPMLSSWQARPFSPRCDRISRTLEFRGGVNNKFVNNPFINLECTYNIRTFE